MGAIPIDVQPQFQRGLRTDIRGKRAKTHLD